MADGMFGSIYDVQATDDLMRQKQAQSYGTGWQAMTRAAAGAGGMLGKGISRAFGGMTPLEAKQAKMQEVIAQFPDLDPSDPGQLEEVEAALWNAGLYDQAKMVGEQAVKRYEAQTGRITAMKPSGGAGSTEFERYITSKALACNGDPACLQEVAQLRDAHYQNKSRGEGTGFERYIAKETAKCKGDPACLERLAKQEEAHYMKGTGDSRRQWQYEAQQKKANIRSAAKEMGVTLTDEKVNYIAQLAKDEVVFNSETGQIVDTMMALINEHGIRDVSQPTPEGDAASDPGFIETPVSQKIAEQKAAKKKQEDNQNQREEERLAIQKRSEQRAIDQNKKEDVRYIEGRQQDLSEQLGGANIPSLETAISEMEGLIDEFQGRNLPGINPAEKLMMDEDSKRVRSAFARLQNTVLKERSGAAVTNPEFERLQEEIRGAIAPTDKDIIRWTARLREEIEADKQNIFAGYGESVHQSYWKAGGSVRFGRPATALTPAPTVRKVPVAQIRADAKKYGWSEQQTQDAITKYGE